MHMIVVKTLIARVLKWLLSQCSRDEHKASKHISRPPRMAPSKLGSLAVINITAVGRA